MPDFSILQPLTVTQDQRGSSFNAGIGDANTSGLGSFLEGFQEGARDWTVTRNLQLEAQTKYDPDKIAAEKLRRDMENLELEEKLTEMRTRNKYLPVEKELGLQSTVVDIEGKQYKNRSYAMEAYLDEKYGEAKTQSELANTQASTASVRASTAGTILSNQQKRRDAIRDIALGDDLAEIELATKMAKLEEDKQRAITPAQIADLQGTRLRALEGAQKYRETLYNSPEYTTAKTAYADAVKDKTPYQIEKELKNPASAAYKAQKKLDSFNEELNKFSTIEQESNSLIPKKIEEIPPTPGESYKASLLNRVRRSQQERIARRSSQLENDAIALESSEATANRAFEVSRGYSRALSEAVTDYNSGTGIRDSKSVTDMLSSLNEAKGRFAKTEDDNKSYTNLYAPIFESTQFVEDLLEDIERSEKDPDRRSKRKREVYQAALETGRTDILQPIQKNLLELGATPKHLSDPDKTIQGISLAITKKQALIDDPELLKLSGGPEVGRYFDTAKKASKFGSQGFSVYLDEVVVGAGGEDISGNGPKRARVMRFEGQDGSSFDAPFSEGPKDLAAFAILGKISEATAEQAVINNKAAGTVDTLNREAQAREEAVKNPPKAPTPPSRREALKASAIQKAVAKFKAANGGREPSPATLENFKMQAEEGLAKQEASR